MSLYDAPDSRYRDCAIFRWNGDPGACRACNAPLSGRRRRWCSVRCEGTYADNHFWTSAAPARLKLDEYQCQRCGVQSEPRLSSWEFYQRHDISGPVAPPFSCWTVRKAFAGPPLEVHHVFPLAQQFKTHSQSGCHHHLSLLVTLCHSCHRDVEKITTLRWSAGIRASYAQHQEREANRKRQEALALDA